MKTRRKILITTLAIVLLYVVIVEVDNYFYGSLHQTSIHQSVDNPELSFDAQDISEISGLEIIDVTPEMWEENQKRSEERNAIRLEQLEKLNNDEDFVNAGKIIQGLNSTNIEDDVYWQTVIESLVLVIEKQGISLNDTFSFEDSEQLRDLLRQDQLHDNEGRIYELFGLK